MSSLLAILLVGLPAQSDEPRFRELEGLMPSQTVSRDSLHSQLSRSLTTSERDVSVPTGLAQRELDIRVPVESIGNGQLSCNFDYSVLSPSDYDEIQAYRNLNQETWEQMDREQKYEVLSSVYKGAAYWLGYASQEGAVVNIDRENKRLSGSLVSVVGILSPEGLNFNDRNYYNELKSRVDALERERFSIDEDLDETWSALSGDATIYIIEYPTSGVGAPLTLELRVFENWQSDVTVRKLGQNFFGGYAQLLLYNQEGFLYAFNIGSCQPAMF